MNLFMCLRDPKFERLDGISIDTNPYGKMNDRPLGLTNGSMEENEDMGGKILSPPKGSVLLCGLPSLAPIVPTNSSCPILLNSSITSYSILEEDSLPEIEWVLEIFQLMD